MKAKRIFQLLREIRFFEKAYFELRRHDKQQREQSDQAKKKHGDNKEKRPFQIVDTISFKRVWSGDDFDKIGTSRLEI